MEIIGISQKHNNRVKRHRKHEPRDSTKLTLYYKDDLGKFKTKKISRLEALKLKLLVRKSDSNMIKILECSECGFQAQDLGQKVCESCGN